MEDGRWNWWGFAEVEEPLLEDKKTAYELKEAEIEAYEGDE